MTRVGFWPLGIAACLALFVPILARGQEARDFLERLRADPPDVLVVLGSKVIPGRNLHRRVDAAAEIHSALEAKPDVIGSGGNAMGAPRALDAAESACAVKRANTEHDETRRQAVLGGEPQRLTEAETICAQLTRDHRVGLEKILIEARARTTIENAVYSSAILKTRTYRHVLIVTTTEGEPNHASRALRQFVRQRRAGGAVRGYRLSAVSWPYEGGPSWLFIEPAPSR